MQWSLCQSLENQLNHIHFELNLDLPHNLKHRCHFKFIYKRDTGQMPAPFTQLSTHLLHESFCKIILKCFSQCWDITHRAPICAILPQKCSADSVRVRTQAITCYINRKIPDKWIWWNTLDAFWTDGEMEAREKSDLQLRLKKSPSTRASGYV